MKRTTYIFMAMFVFGLVAMVAGMFVYSLQKEGPENIDFLITGKPVTLPLNEVRVVKMWMNQQGVPPSKYYWIRGQTTVVPSETGKEEITYPQSDYLKVRQQNDTLLVELDCSLERLPEALREKNQLTIDRLDIQLAVGPALEVIYVDVETMRLKVMNLALDSLHIRPNHLHVEIDSCRFRSLSLDGNQITVYAQNSGIENFYLNLDEVTDWTLRNTKIGTEFLSGSGYCKNNLQKGEAKRVVWTPLSEEGKLELILQEKAVVEIAE